MKKLYITVFTLVSMSASYIAQTNTPTKEEASAKEMKSHKSSSVAREEEKKTKLKSKTELKGDKEYFIYSYDKAIEQYASEEQLTADGQRNLAVSYYKMSKFAESDSAYLKLFSMNDGIVPEDYFNYSMSLKATGKYNESAKWMDKFVAQKPQDLRAIDYKANKAQLPVLMTSNEKYKIVNLSINSDAEDFGMSYYKDKIVFASSRTSKSMPKKSYRNGKPYLNIYVADIDNGQLKNPENFDKKFNGKMNEGPASFNADGTFMAFTRNNYDLTKKELIVNVEIYFSTYNKEKGKWSEPEGFTLNDKTYSVGHPALTADGKTMYFTCDMPIGFGGADLYRVSKKEDGTWSIPENLGDKINTEGDEVFPFFQEKKGILYFSSNGRFGLGGLDIFSSRVKDFGFEKAINAGADLNSVADDFSIIVDSTITKGYFSSNRAGGKGDDDIYSVAFVSNAKINGHALDKDKNVLASAFITLLNDKGDILDTVTTKSDGAFSFAVEKDKNFKLTGTKEKYDEGSNSFATFGTEPIVKSDITLLVTPKKEVAPIAKKEVPLAKNLVANHDLGKIVGFKPIYFDYREYKILPLAEVELDKIVKAMNESPEMIIALNAHTDCRASSEFNQVLSDKRAKASVDYIAQRIKHPERITGKGYGETKLINKCACETLDTSECSDQAHQENRRTEFIIVKK